MIDLKNLNELSLLGESASPFIDEGDGLTSEGERVRMLLSLVAHAGGYMMMVGGHCWMSDACGRLCRLVSDMADVGICIYC